MDQDILQMLLVALVIFVPVAGLTVRFAMKPMVDSIARLLEARTKSNGNGNGDQLERRVALLEQELRLMRTEVSELTERSEFYEKLTGSTH